MSNLTQENLCQEVEDRIADVVGGTADMRLLEHIAGCDRCRDLRFDAEAVASALTQAGDDYVHPQDFEARLMDELTKLSAADTKSVPTLIEPGPAVVEPGPAVVEPGPAVVEPAPPSPSTLLGMPPSAVEPLPVEPAASPLTQPMPAAQGVADSPAMPTPSEPVQPSGAADESARASVATAVAASEGGPVAQAAPRPLSPPSAGKNGLKLVKVIGIGALAVGSLAAAAGVAIYARSTGDEPKTTATEAWTAKVAAVKVAGKDKAGGLQSCNVDGSSCKPVTDGATIESGALLRTDQRTRVRLEMSDGTQLALGRDTELTVGNDGARLAGVRRGVVVADVAHLDDGPGARFELPLGVVEVLGTKLTLAVTEDRASVEVARGAVKLAKTGGESVVVRAGEEGTLEKGAEPSVMPAASLGESVAWSERVDVEEGPEDQLVRGLGELRAKKPGGKGELNQAVRLTKHDVKVRISGQIARTEIDETFSNDTGDVLEGIYRFPLPPDAQIERLALEVDGKMEEGAFVDKERAAAIWRGVIHAAAPKSPKPREEIVWVPGPWRDPALLEWQRGGRFELRIYPIPANGSRRVVLAYTQRIPRSGGVRKYTYPLSYDPSGSTTVESFNVDVQVRGHDKAFGVRSRGYDFEAGGEEEGAKRLSMSEKSFVPSGDITLDYALTEDDKEVTAWAYQPGPADNGSDEESAKDERAKDDRVDDRAADEGAYVAIALRPRLPRWSEGKHRDQVIVVDASRSMMGERFHRASLLAQRVVQEMDRRDRFAVMACDTECTRMDGAMRAPGGAAAQQVKAFLDGIEPDGGSDLVESVRQARKLADQDAEARELRIVYIGDGTPSVGPVRPPHIMQEVARVLPPGSGAMTAVAVGADADTHALAAMARGGGGVMIPYVPGEQIGAVAMRVLGASYGLSLRNPVVELPEGMTAVYPKMLDNIPAGGETIVVARMRGNVDGGSIKLHGKVGGEKYEQTYPITVSATSAKGNAFVPRLYAATKIGDLEANQGDSAKEELIDLSKRFAVASRYTSLLVLESAAMFKAFGIDRNTSTAPLWTGEDEGESSGSDGVNAYAETEDDGDGLFSIGGGGGKDEAKKSRSAAGAGYGAPAADMAEEAYAAPPPKSAPPPAATATMATPSRRAPAGCMPGDLACAMRAGRDRGSVPMRRVWDRKATVSEDTSLNVDRAEKAIAEMEREVSDNPDSRTKLERLLGLYAVAGRVDRASEIAERWAKRDALDPGALVARAEAAARRGDRAKAIRILGGLADVRPGDPDTQKWLASLHETSGEEYLACSHRIALAGLRMKDAEAVAGAIRCAQNTQRGLLASTIRSDVTDESVRSQIDRELAKSEKGQALRGDIRIEATWDEDVDLDVALIGPNGQRYAWLGDPKGRVSARDATSRRRETIAIFNAPRGDFVVEVTRANVAEGESPVRGSLKISAAGTNRSIPFVLSGARSDVARVNVYYTARLEPILGW